MTGHFPMPTQQVKSMTLNVHPTEVAAIAMDKCIVKGPEGASSDDHNFWVEFNYEFLDDTFSQWGAESKQDKLQRQGTYIHTCVYLWL